MSSVRDRCLHSGDLRGVIWCEVLGRDPPVCHCRVSVYVVEPHTSPLSGRPHHRGHLQRLGRALHRHGRGSQEDQVGGGRRHLDLRHGQVRRHPGPADVPGPVQANLLVHSLGPAGGGDARGQRPPDEDHGAGHDGGNNHILHIEILADCAGGEASAGRGDGEAHHHTGGGRARSHRGPGRTSLKSLKR